MLQRGYDCNLWILLPAKAEPLSGQIITRHPEILAWNDPNPRLFASGSHLEQSQMIGARSPGFVKNLAHA